MKFRDILKWIFPVAGFFVNRADKREAESMKKYIESMGYSVPDDFEQHYSDGKYSVDESVKNIFGNVIDKYAGTGLTDAEKEANAFSAEEAQKSRDFQEFMARNKYQMETQSMQEAGINPAMVYGGGSLVPTASNGAAPSSVAPSTGNLFDVISVLARLPEEIKAIRSSAERDRKEGVAALKNADTNARNAEINAENAETNRRVASVQELRQQVDALVARSNIELNDVTKDKLAKDASYILEQTNLLERRMVVAEKNASSQEKSALASLRNADAAVQNAATNDRLSDYQTSLLYAQEYVEWANKEGKEIVNRYLDEKQQKELENLGKQGKLLDSQRHFLTSQQVSAYVNAACNVSNAVNRWINPLAGMSDSVGQPTPISPDMLYGNFGTYYGD